VTSQSVYCVQITTLVNAKEKPIHSERTLTALVRVGQAVNLAVERFVAVGEAIARDNPEIQRDMCDACRDARTAGICCIDWYFVSAMLKLELLNHSISWIDDMKIYDF